jgi:CRISPR-associated protein Csb2
MGQHLVVAVRFHDRFHGTALGAPEWPPSPARLFQALVAGAARGNGLPENAARALGWLECLEPPVIAAPRAELGSEVALFVPNNDADAVADPRDVSEIRVKKVMQPRLFETNTEVLYLWALPDEHPHSTAIVDAAHEIYQLGRGIDMAWAAAEVVGDAGRDARLDAYPGTVHEPNAGGRGLELACPIPGSLASLEARHHASRLSAGPKGVTLFTNAPKPRFLRVSYARTRSRALYELRSLLNAEKRQAWPLNEVVSLVEHVRDAAATRLTGAMPDDAATIEAAIVGRANEDQRVGPEDRVRILALPSIGHPQVNHAIRRIAVEVPSGCPLDAADVEWAFAGLEVCERQTRSFVLARADDPSVLERFGVTPAGTVSRRWRSLTAVALPERAKRRRIEPTRRWEERKGAPERIAEEQEAMGAVATALRHAGVRARLVRARVQREPFEARGARAEAFAPGTRFPKERLWHVELELDAPIEGPLVIGDGRFLGLGTMTPGRRPRVADGLYAFEANAPLRGDSVMLARAARRALMARIQDELHDRLPGFFSGHVDGQPLRDARSTHVAVHSDRTRNLLLVVAPHRLDRRRADPAERRHLRILASALDGFADLRAGRAGRYAIERAHIAPDDPLLGRGKVWTSVEPYTATRHRKGMSASQVLQEDVVGECRRRGVPPPENVEVLSVRGVPGRGVEGMLRLTFGTAVLGPLVLGRTRYLGGGLFTRARVHPERAS